MYRFVVHVWYKLSELGFNVCRLVPCIHGDMTYVELILLCFVVSKWHFYGGGTLRRHGRTSLVKSCHCFKQVQNGGTVTILKSSSNRPLFKLIISEQTLIKLKQNFALICAS